MATLILFNKPYRVMPQFTDAQQRQTLADYIALPGVYPAGRLDYDSEGLMLLTDDGRLQQRIADPAFKMEKTYWVQVEGEITNEALNQLARGVHLNDGVTRPAKAARIDSPALWPRTPPVRYRKNQPTSWIELKISEGRNRQVRRMTASVGFPTLRLARIAIGEWSIHGLKPGDFKTLTINLPASPRAKKQTNNRLRTDQQLKNKGRNHPASPRDKNSARIRRVKTKKS